jgi:hypothetical protein
MVYKNLRIKDSKGVFYESHNSKQKDSVEVETLKGPRWHIEQPNIEGKLHSFKLKEAKFDDGTVELAELSVTSPNNEAQQLSIQIFTGKKDAFGNNRMSDWAVQLAYFLDQLNLGDDVKIGLNTKEKDKSEKYLKKTMFFRVDDTPLKRSYNRENTPEASKRVTKDKLTKKETESWDFSDQHAFFYDVLQKNAQRLQGRPQEAPVEDDDEIQLPF